VGAIFIAVVALGFAVPASRAPRAATQAVAYQLDAGHDGYQSGDPITAPCLRSGRCRFRVRSRIR